MNSQLGQDESHAVATATRHGVDWPTMALRLAWVASVFVVVVGSLLPDGSLPMRALARLQISDKIQHFGAYAGLAFLPAIHERRRVFGAIAFGLIALGVMLEFGQPFEGRDFEYGDMVANTLGVLIGTAIGLPLRNSVQRRMGRLRDQFSL